MIAVIQNITVKKNLAIILILIFQPVMLKVVSGLEKFGQASFLNLIDELLFAFMLAAILINIIKYGMVRQDKYLILFYLFYSSFLIVVNGLPLRNFAQLFISGKFFIIYYYFLYLLEEDKKRLLFALYRVMLLMMVFSFFFALIQIFLPDALGGVFYSHSESRGLFGVGVNSFFSSRVSYAEFICIFIILNFALAPLTTGFPGYKKRQLLLGTMIIFGFFLLLLTGSRKETVFAYVLVPIVIFYSSNIKNKYILVPFIIAATVIFIALFIIAFQDSNTSALSEKYIRLIIFLKSIEIMNVYFPLGSGPGTFGSTLSMYYSGVYDAFHVGGNILGYPQFGIRGPIYDLFLVTFFAEYGLGGLFLIYFIYMMWKRDSHNYQNSYYSINARLIQKLFSLMLFAFAPFVPMFGNPIGYFIIMVLGILHRDKRKL